MEKYIVYKHISPNGKVYIGMTCNWKQRTATGTRYKANKPFLQDILKYGWKNIKHKIIYSNLSLEEAKKYEEMLILSHKSNIEKFGYNIKRGGIYNSLSIEAKESIKKKVSSFQKQIDKNKRHCKGVDMLDMNGKLIKTFRTITEAGNGNRSLSCNISTVCKGKRKSANGYMWRYAEVK